MKYTEASNLIGSITDNLNTRGVYAWCGFTEALMSSILSMKPEEFANYQANLKSRLKEFETRAEEAGYCKKLEKVLDKTKNF